jgi:hypothetical protein
MSICTLPSRAFDTVHPEDVYPEDAGGLHPKSVPIATDKNDRLSRTERMKPKPLPHGHPALHQKQPTSKTRDSLQSLFQEAQLLLTAKDAFAGAYGLQAGELDLVQAVAAKAHTVLTANWNEPASSAVFRKGYDEMQLALNGIPSWLKYIEKRGDIKVAGAVREEL